ncbi:14139_t:CDS:2, partial [Acaulospora colombiana]
IDHGRLLNTIQCGRKLGSAPLLVGSRPPPNDSLWTRIRDQATKIIMANDPGVLVLIAGDRDYRPLVKLALQHNWLVETWFWSSGVSSFLKSDTIFRSLDNCYRTFSYGLGPVLIEKYHVLEVTDINAIQNLKNEDVLEWFNNLK